MYVSPSLIIHKHNLFECASHYISFECFVSCKRKRDKMIMRMTQAMKYKMSDKHCASDMSLSACSITTCVTFLGGIISHAQCNRLSSSYPLPCNAFLYLFALSIANLVYYHHIPRICTSMFMFSRGIEETIFVSVPNMSQLDVVETNLSTTII